MKIISDERILEIIHIYTQYLEYKSYSYVLQEGK